MALFTSSSAGILHVTNKSLNHTANSNARRISGFSNLYPTLVECFGIILVGYIAGRKNIVSETQGRGIGIFVTTIALPATIFKSMVELKFDQVYWNFWLAIFTSKAILMIFVAAVTLLITKPVNYGKAGLLGIFVTQSNDFALGLPLFEAIYKDTHPEYLQYIYLLAPVSLALLNPIGYFLMELQKSRECENKDERKGTKRILFDTIKGILLNPLVYMVIFGLLGNLVFTQHMRSILKELLDTLSSSYGATALFFLGLSLVGNMKKYTGFALVVPFSLVLCKCLILPMLAKEIVYIFAQTGGRDLNTTQVESISTFGFLYGTLPTAPPVVLYATKYNLDVDMVATSMVLGTLLSAPIMFVSTKMISILKADTAQITKLIAVATCDVSFLSLVCCVWVFAVFMFSKDYRRLPQQFTLSLLCAQFLSSLSIPLGKLGITGDIWIHFLFGMIFAGLLATHCWTAVLAYSLSVLRCKGEKQLRNRRYCINMFGWGIPMVIGITLSATFDIPSSARKGDKVMYYLRKKTAFNACYTASMIASFVLTIVSLVILQRSDKYCRCKRKKADLEKQPLIRTIPIESEGTVDDRCHVCKSLGKKFMEKSVGVKTNYSSTNSEGVKLYDPNTSCNEYDNADLPDNQVNIESLSSSTCLVRKSRSTSVLSPLPNEELFNELKDIEELTVDEYFQGEKHKLSQHVILILVLSSFTLLDIFLSLWRLFGVEMVGVYLEMEFLVSLCTFGQGFVTFAVFGFDRKLFSLPALERLYKFCKIHASFLHKKINIVSMDETDPSIKHLCDQFKNHHLQQCKKDIVKDLKFHFRTYCNVFRGDHLVDWFVEVGLGSSRTDAVRYGNVLLQGRVIKHCTEEHYFYDLPYFYRFCESINSSTDSKSSDENNSKHYPETVVSSRSS